MNFKANLCPVKKRIKRKLKIRKFLADNFPMFTLKIAKVLIRSDAARLRMYYAAHLGWMSGQEACSTEFYPQKCLTHNWVLTLVIQLCDIHDVNVSFELRNYRNVSTYYICIS